MGHRRLAALAALAGCGRIGFDRLGGSDATADADLAAWSTHRQIRIRNPSNEVLVDFPVMLALDATRIDYPVAASDGRDLRFTDRAGGLRDYEIETWNPSDRSIVWVRIPSLPPGDDAEILTMHYGNSAAGPAATPATWSDDFVGVYHFATALRDATPNAHDGAVFGATFGSGAVGPCVEFAGAATSYGVLAYRPAFSDVTTLSGWMRSDVSIPGYAAMLQRMIPNTSFNAEYLGVLAANLFWEVTDASMADQAVTPVPVVVGTWMHLAMVLETDHAVAFLDGVQVATMPAPNGRHPSTEAFFLGGDCDNCPSGASSINTDFLDGGVDEVRLERVRRTPGWISVDAASMRDEIATYE